DIKIHRVRVIPPSWTQILGFDQLAFRSLWFVKKKVNQILRKDSFDLIFFSTTQKGFLFLGPYWKKKFRVPFIVDIQDPFVNDYYAKSGIRPPGGKLKFSISQRLGHLIEQNVLPQAARLISVSKPYLNEIRQRVSCLEPQRSDVIPFPYSANDHKRARDRPLPEWANTDKKIILSAGRGGKDLNFALEAFLKAVSIWGRKSEYEIQFVGTAYGLAEETARSVTPVVGNIGIEGMVHEIPRRQPFLDVLRAQQAAAINLVLGSEDVRYTASKCLPVLNSGKPLLAIFHEESPAAVFLKKVAPAYLCSFSSGEQLEGFVERLLAKLEELAADRNSFDKIHEDFLNFEAVQQARTLSEIFYQSQS
ncbi:MAG: hypothetical protein AAFY98_12395, partial [Verrucomicrobiota bacterium]